MWLTDPCVWIDRILGWRFLQGWYESFYEIIHNHHQQIFIYSRIYRNTQMHRHLKNGFHALTSSLSYKVVHNGNKIWVTLLNRILMHSRSYWVWVWLANVRPCSFFFMYRMYLYFIFYRRTILCVALKYSKVCFVLGSLFCNPHTKLGYYIWSRTSLYCTSTTAI